MSIAKFRNMRTATIGTVRDFLETDERSRLIPIGLQRRLRSLAKDSSQDYRQWLKASATMALSIATSQDG
jgi:hypothetical protein